MALLVCCLGLVCFRLPASAVSAATRVDFTGTVNIDGDCMVSLQMNLHLDNPDADLYYPLPAKAANITVNGSSPAVTRSGNTNLVSLNRITGGQAGDYVVTITYTLPKVVAVAVSDTGIVDKKTLNLSLDILSGFSYPISTMTYTITLPGDFPQTPDFYSTYRQNGLASELNLLIDGKMLTGSTKNGFNDHESVTMTMSLSPDMFPGVSTYQRTGNPELVPMGILAGAALVYWLIFLRTFPAKRENSTMPPEGITAGELGCRLFLNGGDLSMMVLCWAQMGYILIQADGRRILLHKRMDMGNERSLFEVRTFRGLFGEKRVIDASSLSQVFCGICMAMNMTSIVALQVLLSLIFGILAVVSAWQMHKPAFCTMSRQKTGYILAGVAIAVWLILGLIAGVVWIPAVECLGQVLLGFPAAWGGRRTDLNRHDVAQLRGLRHYLKHMPAQDVQRLLAADPEYYFRMVPYAMALGVLHPFTQAFGKRKLPQCPYIATRVHGSRKAEDWETLYSDIVTRMDRRARKMELEKWMAVRFR